MNKWFEVHKINEHLTRITDIAETHFYLVTGSKAAVLLDTGVGCGDLRSLIERLTSLPLTVLITHGHVDHAMGAGQFEDVRISPLDRKIYAEHCSPDFRLNYIHGESNGRPGNPETSFVTGEMLQPPKPFLQFLPLAPGDTFDLGGITVEICEGQGHTPGCLTALLPELRMLLTGDACNPFTFLFDQSCSSVVDYREMLLRLKAATDGKYDRVLLCHGPGGEAPVSMIENVISVCDDILAGHTDDEPFVGFHGETVCIAKAMTVDADGKTFRRADGGIGNIVYNPAHIR